MRNIRFAFFAFILVAVTSAPSFAEDRPKPQKPAMDEALSRAGGPNDKVKVLVQYRKGTSARVRSRLTGKVDRITRDHRGIGALAVEMRRGRLHEVCSEEGVTCHLNAKMKPSSEQLLPTEPTLPAPPTSPVSLPVQPTYDVQGLRATLGVTSADYAASVGVAIIDSGIKPNLDLSQRITAFYDFTQGGIATAASDGYGHGTHVAGLIAGSGALSLGQYVGVAKGARLIGLKVLDSEGQGYASDVIAAIEFAVANRAQLHIDVINLSLGHPIFESPATDPLVQAVEAAVQEGIVVVVSAGNWGLNPITGELGYAGITSPGNAPSVITVGSQRTKATATRTDDEVSLFSSRGPTWYEGRIKPDLVAPGQALAAINHPLSTLFQNPLLHADVAPYIKLSGTSMAAAVASGVVALVIEANRQDEGAGSAPLTPNAIKAILQFSAIPVPYVDNGIPAVLEQGAGGINAAGAIALARAVDPNVPSGQPWLDAAVNPFTTIAGETHAWAQGIVWGDHIVWGDSVTWNLSVWAQGIVWGDDDGIVWGDEEGIVWGDSLIHGGNVLLESFSVWSGQIVWGSGIVWGDDDGDGVVWGDNGIVWGDDDGDGIVWGDIDDGIVWGDDDGVVWGDDDDGVVWGDDDDGVVWGDSVLFLIED